MKKRLFNYFLIVVFLFFSVFLYAEDKLSSFESSIGKSAPVQSSSHHGSNQYHFHGGDFAGNLAGDIFGEIFADVFAWVIIGTGMQSVYRASGNPGLEPESDYLSPRQSGEPLLSFLKWDIAYQTVETDVYSVDNNFEMGWGPLAFKFRLSNYQELDPEDDLEVSQIYGVWRMTFTDQFEMDLAFGSMTFQGRRTNSGSAFSMPVYFYPVKHFGIEFTPVWGNIEETTNITMYDIALVFNMKFMAIKGGYRWFDTETESLDGAFTGISFFY